MEKIAIVIPAHNEEKRIGRTLEEYIRYFSALKKKKELDFEIVVVLNACKDNTRSVVEKHKRKEIIILDFEKGGKGFAVIEGFKSTLERKNDFVGFVDADMATGPEAFYDLARNIKGHHGILASRYMKGSVNYPAMNFRRLVVSRTFNFITRALFLMNYSDTQCGAKLFTRRAAERLAYSIGMTQFAFDIELLYEARKNGMEIAEIPTVWREVAGGTLKVAKDSMKMLLAVLQLRIIKSPFRNLLRPLKPLVLLTWSFTR